MERPHRKTTNLRIGRRSIPGAIYFVTSCTNARTQVFAQERNMQLALVALARMEIDDDFRWLTATVMPDHIHLLFCLGERLDLAHCVAKFKGLITRTINVRSSVWQENAFEHRLRDDEDPEAYAFYIVMNPYRAGLLAIDKVWPGWLCTAPKRFRFLDGLSGAGIPPQQWLERDETSGGTLKVGG